MAFTIDVDYKQLQRELRRIADTDLKNELAAANKDIAQAIVDKAMPNIPVRSGRLRASVRALGNQSGAVGKAGSASVRYAAAIHWGRKRGGVITARPFLRDAAKSIEDDAVKTYEERVYRLFERVSSR
jgi:phage gpG-like protein